MSESKMITVTKEDVSFCIGKVLDVKIKAVADQAWDMLQKLSQSNTWVAEDAKAAEEQKKADLKKEIVQKLWKDARYAANSLSVTLMYQTYGELEMAIETGIVKYDEVHEIHRYIIAEHINDGKWRRMCEEQYRLPYEKIDTMSESSGSETITVSFDRYAEASSVAVPKVLREQYNNSQAMVNAIPFVCDVTAQTWRTLCDGDDE